MPFVADAPADTASTPAPAPKGFVPDVDQQADAQRAAMFGSSPPGSDRELRDQRQAILAREQARRLRESFVLQNANPGIPLNLDESLPAGLRVRVSAETDPARQADIISKSPGVKRARIAADGQNVIATIENPDGTLKDVPLHPMGAPTLSDVAGEAAPLGKAALATGIAFGTGGMSLLGQAGVQGGAMALEHAGQLAASRAAAGQPLDPKDIAIQSGKEGILNAAVPASLALGGGALRFGRGLLTRGAGALEAAVPGAAERLGVQTLPSMNTGSKVLARSEKAAGLADQNATLAGGLKAAEDRQLGLSGAAGVPSEEAVAGKVQPIAQAATDAAEAGVQGAKNTAATAAQQQLQSALDSGIVPSNVPQSEAGKYLRSKLEAFAGNVKAEAEKNYPAFYQKAADEGITLDPKPVSDLVKKIGAEDPSGAAELLAPSIKQVKAVEGKLNPVVDQAADSGLVDQFGRPITAAGKPAEPLSFQEAINLRAIVRKKLNSATDPLGDVVKRYYNQLDGALTDTIDNGLKQGTPELRAAYDKARGSYSEGAQALEQGRLPKLFADANEAGYMPDEKIVPSLFTGQGNLDGLKAWKSVLAPQDYKLLLRQGVNHLIDQSGTAGGYINADTFLNKLASLSPEVRKEMLGGAADDIVNNSRLLASARGAKVDPLELQDALQTPGQAPKLLQEAIDREKVFDQRYNNSVSKALRGGNLGPSNLGDVDTFTSRWLDKAGTADARQAMTQIAAADPSVAEQVRQRALQNILTDSRAASDLGQISTGGNPNIDPSKLAKYLTGAEREKYQVVLGKDGVQFLDDLNTLAEANAKRIAQREGKPLTVEGMAERASAIGEGNGLSLARSLGRAALYLPEAALGNAMRNQSVANFLRTGQLPALGRVTRAVLSSAPEDLQTAGDVRKNVLSETR